MTFGKLFVLAIKRLLQKLKVLADVETKTEEQSVNANLYKKTLFKACFPVQLLNYSRK